MKILLLFFMISMQAFSSDFNSVLPGNLESVSPSDMSFNSDRFIYSDDYKFLKSIKSDGATRLECMLGGWRIAKEKSKDINGKEVILDKKFCEHFTSTPVSESEKKLKIKNAEYIFSHISEGQLPKNIRPQDLVVGKNIPYSGDWYPFYKGSSLENKGGVLRGLFNKKKFQNKEVTSFGPTSKELIEWSRKGKLNAELSKFPMPIIVDILNGKTDPERTDFYEFTRSEQDRLNKVRENYKNDHKGLFAGTIISGWTHDGMCESWSAASINEPLPKDYLVNREIKFGSTVEKIQIKISAELVASANAVLYNRLMFDQMDSLDPKKNPAEKVKALNLIREGYRDLGEACRLSSVDFSRYMDEIGYNSNRVRYLNDENGKNCFDLNFGLLTIVALNKIGVYGDLFFADFTSDTGIWHYPIAAVYLEDLGDAETLDFDRARGTKVQKKVVLHLIRSKTSKKVSKGDFAVESFPGRIDLSESERILGGRFTSHKVLDYLVDIRQPKTEGSPLHIIKWIESQSTPTGGVIEIPSLAR